MKKIYLAIVLFIVATSCFAQTGDGMPGLKISDNKRFITDDKGKPVFWLGDTGWLLFVKTNREEAEKYLEDRRQKGFNVIQVMVVHNVKAAVNIYGDSALVNRDLARPKTTEGNTFGVAGQYDFWDHADYIIDLAAKKGLYMALVPVWGSNVKGGSVSREQAATFAKFLTNRYKSRKNIIWMNGGDVKGSDSIETWKLIGNTLRANDPGHLITFHPFGRHTSSLWFHNEPWLDFNMFQSGHRSYDQDTSRGELHFAVDNWKFVRFDYAKVPAKPTIDGEPSYEKIPYGLHDTLQPYWNDNDVRRYAYWSVFAGAFGFTYGHNSVMQFYKPTDHGSAYGAKNFWFEAINDPGARQMIYLKNLILSKPYMERVSDQTLIADQGVRYNYQAATRGSDYALIYTFNARKITVNMGKIGGTKVKASWYSPRDGSTTAIGEFKNTGTTQFDPPGEKIDGNDWVLILDKLK